MLSVKELSAATAAALEMPASDAILSIISALVMILPPFFSYRLSHIKFHSVIGRRRITIQPPPSGLVKFNM
jgi:hypothetical protein